MELWLQIGLIAIAAVIGIVVLAAQCRTGKPMRGILVTGLQGVCALAAVDIAGIFTGVSLALNVFTGGVALILGLPGIVGVLLLNLIFL